ncbi:MAG: energy transducer TonB, partial [Acetomicrobium sp.]|nr:energy transducer TonB [Acetomicrobium sp.]
SQTKSVQYEKGDGQAGAVNLSNDVSNNSLGWQQKSLQMASDLDILRSVKPTYPLISRRRGEEGTTTIYVRVSSDGTVVEANVYKSSGYDLLDESALKAVKQWVFKSTKEGEFLVPVVFKLKP